MLDNFTEVIETLKRSVIETIEWLHDPFQWALYTELTFWCSVILFFTIRCIKREDMTCVSAWTEVAKAICVASFKSVKEHLLFEFCEEVCIICELRLCF